MLFKSTNSESQFLAANYEKMLVYVSKERMYLSFQNEEISIIRRVYVLSEYQNYGNHEQKI